MSNLLVEASIARQPACPLPPHPAAAMDDDLFDAAYEYFPQPVWLVDPATLQLLRVNRAMCLELGIGRMELLKLTEAELGAPDEGERIFGAYAAIQDFGQWSTYSRKQHQGDGTFSAVQLKFSAVTHQNQPARLVVAHSLRQRRQDTAMRQQIDILKSLVANAGYGLGRYSVRQKRLVFFNQKLLDLIGASDEVTQGLPALTSQQSDYIEEAFVHPEDWAAFLDVARRGQAFQKIVLWRSQKAELRYVRLLSVPVETAEGVQVDLNVEDATEAVQHEQQSRQSQKMEALGRMAGGVAHDFNNLLLVICGHAELMEESLPAESELRLHTTKLMIASRQAADITGTLLTFSRGEEPLVGLLALNKTIRAYADLMPSLLGPEIVLDLKLPQEEFHILANATHVEQVILNLCINARDAMPEGGRVTVRTSHIASRSKDENGSVMLELSDSGVGMDAETRAHIFEPFYTTKARGKGTGLGLALVYGIVTQYGGSIEVETEMGRGTTFRIFFPLGERVVDSPTSRVITSGKKTVLLAEDEPEIRNMVGEFVRKLGHQVLPAGDAEEALEIANSHDGKIDMLLTDVMMPGINGFELALAMRQMHPGLPILVMSGFTGGAMSRRAKELGDVPFLPKPFSFRQLEASLQKLLS